MSRRDRSAKRWLGIAPGPQGPASSDPAETYTLSGTINDYDSAGLDGVTVTLTGDASDSTTTAGGGAYSFTVEDGSYTVTPTKDGSVFSPSSAAVVVSGANKVADTMTELYYPRVWNAEGLTIGATSLSNASTDLPDDGSESVQLASYSTMDAIAGSPARDLTKCWQADAGGGEITLAQMDLGAGNGWVPSDGGTMRVEGVFWLDGTPSQGILYIFSSDDHGISCYVQGQRFFLDTWNASTPTNKVDVAGFSTDPSGVHWFLLSLEYNFSTNAYSIHARGLGSTGAEQENVTRTGTVTSPTFGASKEMIEFNVVSQKTNKNVNERNGVAQLWVCDTSSSFPDGYKQTSNFTP